MNNKEKADYMANLCAYHNCSDEKMKQHVEMFVGGKTYRGGWHSHPLTLFKKWWEPTGFAPNGASEGGHPDAWRCWVDCETGERRWYGSKTLVAWNNDRSEFNEWVKNGMDPEWHNWNSTTVPRERAQALIQECMRTIRQGWVK